jgi:tRNA(Ile)-lysidine synthase
MKNSLKYAFLEFINHHQLIEQKQKILVAVSGGVDSMALLHLLLAWRQYFKINLGVAHFNHHLRGEDSDKDEAFVRETCRETGLAFFCGHGDVEAAARRKKYSREEAARMLREEFFEKCRKQEGFDVTATAHHLDDQAETVLMRLFSGAGLDGLAGIRLRREGFIRPLLFAERAEIENYAWQNNINYREDASNFDLNIPRNKIRRQLLPLLKQEFNLSNLNSFLHTSLVIQEWLPEIDKQVEFLLNQAVFTESQNKIRLDIIPYTKYFSSTQVKLLECILTKLQNRKTELTYNRFRSFSQWLKRAADGDKFRVERAVQVSRKKNRLVFEYQQSFKSIDVYEEIHPGSTYHNRELGISLSIELVSSNAVKFDPTHTVEYLDAQHLTFPLLLRTWQAGDRFQPLGMAQLKKVSDFLTDEKSLILAKEQMLVLENQGEIVAVVGARISEKYKINDLSQQILKLEIQAL